MSDDQDGTWMSYAELGKIRGISKESSLKLALRRKWRKQLSNTGIVRVCVPPGFADQRDIGVDARADEDLGAVDLSVDIERIVNGLGDALTILREQLATAHAANLRMIEDINGLRVQVGVAVTERDEARSERETARIAAARSEGELKALREALADARRPFWKRLLGGV